MTDDLKPKSVMQLLTDVTTDDLISRLRRKKAWTNQRPYWHLNNPDGDEAADRIEALTEALRKAEKALGEQAMQYLALGGQAIELQAQLDAAREALAGIGDDYMTSDKHHPGYVLIPAEKFDHLRVAANDLAALSDLGKDTP